MNRDLECLRSLQAAIDEYNREEPRPSKSPGEILATCVENRCRNAVYTQAAREFTGKRLLTFAKWLPPRYTELLVTALNDRLETLEGNHGFVASLERGDLLRTLKALRYENPNSYDRIDKVLERFSDAAVPAIPRVSCSDR